MHTHLGDSEHDFGNALSPYQLVRCKKDVFGIRRTVFFRNLMTPRRDMINFLAFASHLCPKFRLGLSLEKDRGRDIENHEP